MHKNKYRYVILGCHCSEVVGWMSGKACEYNKQCTFLIPDQQSLSNGSNIIIFRYHLLVCLFIEYNSKVKLGYIIVRSTA